MPKRQDKNAGSGDPSAEDSRYRQIIEEAADVAYTINVQGFFTYVNPASEQLTGFGPQELIGVHFTTLVAHGWRKRLMALYLNQLETHERVTRVEFPIVTKAGQTKWVEQIVSLAETDGQPDGFYSIVRDVTARREMEDSLRRSEAENKALLRAIPDRIFIVKRDGAYIEHTSSRETGGAFISGQLSGENIRDKQLLSPDTIREGGKLLEKVLAEGGVQTFEFEANTSSGPRWFEGRLTPLNGSDQALLIARDITERKRAESDLEQRIMLLAVLQQVDIELNHTLDIHWVLLVALNAAMVLSSADAGGLALVEDKQFRLAQVSGKFLDTVMPLDKGIIGRVLRTQQAEVVLDVSADPDYVQVLPPTRAEIAIPLIFHGTLIGGLELETSDPTQFTEEIFEAMKLLAARVASAVENARLYEISQSQLAELKKLYEQVSNLEQLKSDMIRLTAHDLRGPIGVVRGYIELIEQDLGAQAQGNYQTYFNSIRRALERVERMSTDILSLERIHAALGQPQDLADLRELLDRAVMDFRPASRDKGQSFEVAAQPEHLLVKGDATHLYEAIANLVGNAIKYTRDHGRIELFLREVGTLAVFEVKDTGYGVPEDMQHKLFEPFFRAKTDETRNIDGTGLGLYLVSKIIKRHGGKMRVHSVYGQGSTFGFELPVADAAAPPSA